MCSDGSRMWECGGGEKLRVVCAHCGMLIEGQAATCDDCGEPVCPYCDGEGCTSDSVDEGENTDSWGRYGDRRSIAILWRA